MYKEHTIERVNQVSSEPEITSIPCVETPKKRPHKKRYLRKRDRPKLIALLAQGFTNRQIGIMMNRSQMTIEFYLLRLRRKYNARNTMHLVMLYLKEQGCTLPFNDLL